MSFLSINHLGIAYGKTIVLQDFSLAVEEGSIYCFVGPSGCGKSTLLKSICGIIKPNQGEILLRGKNIKPAENLLGYIPQLYGLPDWLTVKSNLFMGKKIRKIQPSPEDDQIIEQLGIKPLLNRYPKELSGGQQQRVALARAWMLHPELMLMDEPFSSLDAFTAERSRELFLQLWKVQKTTTLFVTHNIREAVHIGKYIVLLTRQPAMVSDILENPLFQSGASRTLEDYSHMEQLINQRIKEIGGLPND